MSERPVTKAHQALLDAALRFGAAKEAHRLTPYADQDETWERVMTEYRSAGWALQGAAGAWARTQRRKKVSGAPRTTANRPG